MSIVNLPFSSFLTPRQTIAARGALASLSALSATRIAIICSKRLSKNETLMRISGNAKRAEYQVINPDWNGEPTISSIKKTLAQIEDFAPDYIVAIGGGSIIDGAKIVWALYENPLFPIDRLSVLFSLPELRKKAKFCAIPTTIGTGSEASSSAVLYNDESGVKLPVVTHDFLPDLVILDSELVDDLPDQWKCMTALDALSHAIEGFFSTQDNPIAQSMVVPAIRKIMEALDGFGDNTKNDYSLIALEGAYLAGIIQNLMVVGPAHAIAHQLGNYNIPHGLATGVLLPEVLRFYASESEELSLKLDLLSKDLGFSSSEEFIDKIKSLPTRFGVEISKYNWDMVKSEKELVSTMAKKDFLVNFFPLEISEQQLQQIIEKV